MIRRMLVSVALSTTFFALQTEAHSEEISLPGLTQKVEVAYDAYLIPHVTARTWEDAARALGYLHAGERPLQMEFFRRMASGTLAEILGPDQLTSDLRMRQLQIRRSTQAWFDSGEVPPRFRAELEAYAAGVNARMSEGLPEMVQALGIQPAPWTPVDSIVFSKYMAWDQSGTEDDLWFGMIVEKMGIEASEALWPLERPYEVPTVRQQANRPSGKQARLEPVPDIAKACLAALERWDGAGWLGRGGAFGSNNWAIDGSKTESGKPILCSDPHLGFSLPSIWYTAIITVGKETVAGAMFPTAPFIVIGHNMNLGWGITNMQADSVDYFIETVDGQEPQKYLHRGEWKRMERVREEIGVRGAAPHIAEIDYTVHGPVINREGRVISMQWNGFGRSRDGLTIWGLNRAKNLGEALAALDELASPPLNMVYADVEGNIMIHPCGALPLRGRGQGRVPMDGASGDYDWQGFIPRDELPLALNPPEHFVASANGRPHPLGYPHYVGWMWDPSYRTRRIHDMLSGAGEMTLAKMESIQFDAYDKAAESFLPVFLAAMKNVDLEKTHAQALLHAVSQWDHVASGATPGPMIWQEWLSHYRSAVWDDEWAAHGIEKLGGSWGFTGDNRREPMLEVLEFLTREMPDAPWFDDRATPEREGRDTIVRRAFENAANALQQRFGEDLAALAWDKINILRIGALTQIEEHARIGGPVPGAGFTVNPGSEGGHVGGGASWRMIVDFGSPLTSEGVYPGGQSGDPASPHYDDQMKLWATGQYLPLIHPDNDLPARTLAFTP